MRDSLLGESASIEGFQWSAPRPDTRLVTALYRDHPVCVKVLQDVVSDGTHTFVTLGDPGGMAAERTIEYITDYTSFEDAMTMGLEVARAAADGREA
ncbi:MAG: hypothetical protein JSR59_20020 [Proteobacteria bacterium]|nr:hypothetical protein [Pseudomonadota bacterium]